MEINDVKRAIQNDRTMQAKMPVNKIVVTIFCDLRNAGFERGRSKLYH